MSEIIKRKGEEWTFLTKFIQGLDHCATTFFSTIYMPKWYFVTPAGVNETALLLHEKTHVRQWEKDGWGFIFGYLFSVDSRKKYELEAYKNQIYYLMSHDYLIIKEDWAKMLSTLYSVLDFITYDEAYKTLEEWELEFKNKKGN